MFHHLVAVSARLYAAASSLLLSLATWWATGASRPTYWRARLSDNGSETTEKAVITSIVLGLALGLGAAIRAAVQHYQGQIH